MCFCSQPVVSHHRNHPSSEKTPRRTYVFWVVRGDAHHPVKWHFVPLLADNWVGKIGGCTSGGVAENLRMGVDSVGGRRSRDDANC